MSQLKGTVARVGSTVVAYAMAQVVNGLGGLIRIPLLVGVLGAKGYGVLSVVLALWPWLASGGEAVRQATRLRAAELGHSHAMGIALDMMRKPILVAGAASALLAVAMAPILGATMGSVHPGGIGFWEVALSVAILGALAGSVSHDNARSGVLEATGRTAAVNGFGALTTIIGLPLLLAGVVMDLPLPMLVLLVGCGFVAPVVGLRVIRTRADDPPEPLAPESSSSRLTGNRSLVANMWLWSVAGLLGWGLDTVIVGVVLGSEEAGIYAVAQRLLTVATLVPLALAGQVTAHFARLRATEPPAYLYRALRLVTLGYLAASIITSGLFFLAGPPLARLLGRGLVAAPVSLYAVLTLAVLLGCVASPLFAALTTPTGLRTRNVLILASAIVNVLLTVVLTPVLGLVGPAIGTALANLFVLIALLLLLGRRPEGLIVAVRSNEPDLDHQPLTLPKES